MEFLAVTDMAFVLCDHGIFALEAEAEIGDGGMLLGDLVTDGDLWVN